MRVLLIKTSSMGDVIHTLPALTDAQKHYPDIQFDWIVEESFTDIPHWHKAVNRIIPVALRRWRKAIFSAKTRQEWRTFREQLDNQYDVILDAQGLVKSAFLTLFAKGERVGLDFQSARERFAALFYERRITVNFYQHAVVRMRQLFSLALNYSLPTDAPAFDLSRESFQQETNAAPYLVFLHSTTWSSKLWPEAYWLELARLAAQNGFRIKISGGNEAELARAKRLAMQCENIDALPRLEIFQMATLLASAKAAVAVDTGFGHLAAALDIPTVSLYGATNATFTGALGGKSTHLSADFSCAPCLKRTCHYKAASSVSPACYEALTPLRVWNEVERIIRY